MLVMALMGLGLGCNMQPIILAVQNAASPRELGVSTSAVTFFRSMGGTLGAAIFLSVLFTTLPDKIRSAFTVAQGTAAFQTAVQQHPASRRPPPASPARTRRAGRAGRGDPPCR